MMKKRWNEKRWSVTLSLHCSRQDTEDILVRMVQPLHCVEVLLIHYLTAQILFTPKAILISPIVVFLYSESLGLLPYNSMLRTKDGNCLEVLDHVLWTRVLCFLVLSERLWSNCKDTRGRSRGTVPQGTCKAQYGTGVSARTQNSPSFSVWATFLHYLRLDIKVFNLSLGFSKAPWHSNAKLPLSFSHTFVHYFIGTPTLSFINTFLLTLSHLPDFSDLKIRTIRTYLDLQAATPVCNT